MKKIVFAALSLMALGAFVFTGCTKKENKKLKIGIAKIVKHPAMDSIEKGITDRLAELGIDAEYDLQNANGQVETAKQIAVQFKDEGVDYAVGIATPVAVALALTITDRPVIFSCITDPVEAKLVDTTDHGKGNVTGVSDYIPSDEHIALFQEIAGIKTLGYIYTSSEANSQSGLKIVEDACKKLNIKLITQSITTSTEVKSACESIVNSVDGLYLTTDNTVFSAIDAVKSVFNKAHKPIFSGDVTSAETGGFFMARGFNYYKAGVETADLIVKIIEGEKPENLPVVFPATKDLLFDLDVAADCGIFISEEMLSQANKIFKDGKLEVKEN